jgi:crotonobetainyl-CoA:carnitine CoA-transferase CaiB-like acyl-CoA transferase
MAAMLLADLGAEVIRIDRFGPSNLGYQKAQAVRHPGARTTVGGDRPEASGWDRLRA